MKILVSTPFVSSPAGVSNHYLGLKSFFSKDVVYNQYVTNNFLKRKLKLNDGFLLRCIRLVLMGWDVLKFSLRLLFGGDVRVLFNPSFGATALKRDLFFAKIAKFFGKKYSFFIHGWTIPYLNDFISGEKVLPKEFYETYSFFVLANEFKDYLVKLGVKSPIYLTTTKVNDVLLDGVELQEKKVVKNILFLARIEVAKGIFTTIDAFKILQEKGYDLKLTVVGAGNALEDSKKYVFDNGIQNVCFTGALYGDDLKQKFIESDIYILPTHGEGMPTSVLEAMALGLPVITRPVGGLCDFFENDKMGWMLESLDSQEYANKIECLINNMGLYNRISCYNSEYARNRFLASKVAVDLEKKLKQ